MPLRVTGFAAPRFPAKARTASLPSTLRPPTRQGATTRFPSLLKDNSPVRECVVMFGDANPGGSFGVYHLWITQTNATRWSQMTDLSNEGHDCTMVSGTRGDL